ncbi:MAG: hypothetical protein D3924_13000 [Candidatus Electrothrix sp. AR4]|nr:hypothetical protein [Candidatus Electrothrix sp. AR4]
MTAQAKLMTLTKITGFCQIFFKLLSFSRTPHSYNIKEGTIVWRTQNGHSWEPVYQEGIHIVDGFFRTIRQGP